MLSRLLSTSVAAAALATAIAAPAGAATWTPAREATRAGQASWPVVAADPGGRFTLGYIRERGGAYRAELRRGVVARGLRGGPLVLDASDEDLSALALKQFSTGRIGVAWLRHEDRAQGPRAATVTADGEMRGPVDLVPAGTDSASAPRWVSAPGADPLLVWDRRSGSAAATLDGHRWGTPMPLPGAGIASQVSVVAERGGGRIAVWAAAGRVLAAEAPARGAFGAPVILSGPGTARDPQLARSADGTVVAGWVRNEGTGNVMEVAARPPGGSFRAPVALSGAGEGAFYPRLVASSAGEVVGVWVSGTTARGWGGARGPLRMRRLTGDGVVEGRAVTLTPSGVRTAEPTLADDGRGTLLVAWSAGPLAAREMGVRRVTRTGLGAVQELSAGRCESTAAPALAAAAGRAVIAWTADGVVRFRLLR